ncbi:hypothetical protein DPEC_G00226430 [Dallia pectoralis]|uniref:Uncharacterized protein n=1 Tax=Dallia pectoralis TaxID=75939 RepID=A0ACC2G0X6_DALPE|nr:hypothetical protein DPEC_G00226430 [Dallia pectoralis]
MEAGQYGGTSHLQNGPRALKALTQPPPHDKLARLVTHALLHLTYINWDTQRSNSFTSHCYTFLGLLRAPHPGTTVTYVARQNLPPQESQRPVQDGGSCRSEKAFTEPLRQCQSPLSPGSLRTISQIWPCSEMCCPPI